MWEQTDGGHVRVGDLDIGGVDAVVAFRMHAKARLGGGRRDQLDSSVTRYACSLVPAERA